MFQDSNIAPPQSGVYMGIETVVGDDNVTLLVSLKMSRLGVQEYAVTLTPDEAIAYGQMIVKAATEVKTDSIVARWLTSQGANLIKIKEFYNFIRMSRQAGNG